MFEKVLIVEQKKMDRTKVNKIPALPAIFSGLP
jgi:hypothetical protein